jgi:4-amino-4-deoxy-L-arabinose transferase-like glycosyltransferase
MAAIGVALLAALLALLSEVRLPTTWPAEEMLDGALFAIALFIYGITTAVDLLPADAGEFQLTVPLLGIAHPPGYPLYTMAGALFTRIIPWGTSAYRLNVMSAVLAAATLVLLARATRLWARKLGAPARLARAGGLAAALVLGSATTFWAQATIANIRMPTAFFMALALLALARFATAEDRRAADRALVLLALAAGLGGTHHPSLAFPGLFFIIYVLLTDPKLLAQPRRWWRPVLAILAGFLPLAYLPIRGAAGAIQNPGGLTTLQGFLNHVLARGFAGDMFAFANAADLPDRLALLPTLFPFQFNGLILLAAFLGLVLILRHDWRLFVLLAGSLVLHTFVTITYRAPQTVEYLMPAYLPVAVAVGLLPAALYKLTISARGLPPRLVPAVLALVIWAGALNGIAHAPSFFELAGDRTAREAVQPLLQTAPEGARILANWRWFTPLRYLQEIEGWRQDVELGEVYPVAGEAYHDTWLYRAEETPPDQPVLLTQYYEFAAYTTEPWDQGFLLRPRPVSEPATSIVPAGIGFDEQIELVGYNLLQNEFHPGDVVEVVLAWRPTGPLDPPPSFTLRLLDAEGGFVSQADWALESDVALHEVRFVRLALPVYPYVAPGAYQIVLGAYAVTGAGFETLPVDGGDGDATTLVWLEVAPSSEQPFTLHPRSTPFAGGPTLVGVDFDNSDPTATQVTLHWRGPSAEGSTVDLHLLRGETVTAWLPPIPEGAYQTSVLRLPGQASRPLALSLIDEAGNSRTAAGAWGWGGDRVWLLPPRSSARFVPLGDTMTVAGADARAEDEWVTVDVTLVGLRPLTADYSTSVRLTDAEGRWLASHDSQPALGAIPTLKWIRGSTVVDRHVLELPDDFAGGDVTATLIAYERFRLSPLVPMDGRFYTVPLGTWTIGE